MTEQEACWFKKLTDERTQDAKTFSKPEYVGFWNTIGELYKESAHFIYELIQNADDAGATRGCFELSTEKLVFRHNGKSFSISDPGKIKEDKVAGKLGDINAITSIAYSSKAGEQSNSIGKFGVGFKAVFTYTETPKIYCDNVCFRIEQKIIPIKLKDDFKGRKEGETVFVFPFDNSKKNLVVAFHEIEEQLSKLQNPTLFLNKLESISYCIKAKDESKFGEYKKTVKERESNNDITAELIEFDGSCGNEKESLWVFSRKDGKFKYFIGFGLKADRLVPREDSAYCYFQTEEDTHLKFIIQAPFLLTPDRQHLNNENHNFECIEKLATLAADSVEYLCEKHPELISDEILDIIPIKYNDFYLNDGVSVKNQFFPFYKKIQQKFKTSKIIPAKDGMHAKAEDSFRPVESNISEVISDSDLSKILGKKSYWVFPTRKTNQYLNSDERNWINEVLGKEHGFSDRNFIERISAKFIEGKFSDKNWDWFEKFYDWLDEEKERRESAKKYPFFVDFNGHAVKAYENDRWQLFLPAEQKSEYPTINYELCKIPKIKDFYKKIGFTFPSPKDEIYTKILPRYAKESFDEGQIKLDFEKIWAYAMICLDKAELFEKLKKEWRVRCKSLDGAVSWKFPTDVYLKSDSLQDWFDGNNSVYFVDSDFYKENVSSAKDEDVKKFWIDVGVNQHAKKIETKISLQLATEEWGCTEESIRSHIRHSTACNIEVEFSSFEGLENVKRKILEPSSAMVKEIIFILRSRVFSSIVYKCGNGWLKNEHKIDYNGNINLNFVKNNLKIRTINGEAKISKELCLDEIESRPNSKEEIFQLIEMKELFQILEIKERSKVDISQLDTETQNALKTLDRFKSAGINLDKISDEKLEKIKQFLNPNPEQNSSFGWGQKENVSEEKTSANENKNSEIQIQNKDEREETFGTKSKVLNEIIEKTKTPIKSLKVEDLTDIDDADDRMPHSYKTEKLIQKAEELAVKLNQVGEITKIQQELRNAGKYTFQWFKEMLKLESLISSGGDSESKEISISFGQVEKGSTSRTIILRKPNKRIPSEVENLYDLNLNIRYRDRSEKKVTFKSASIHSFSLHLKLLRESDISALDYENISEASISAKSPVFLLHELQKQFDGLPLENKDNLKEKLCQNIDFVFGPPGTGKTTHLANELLDLVNNENVNVLVLAPTNKAADVLTKRIVEKSDEKRVEYVKFLTRFGTTNDGSIEGKSIFKGRSFDPDKNSSNIVITTVARLPYDSCVIEGKSNKNIREIRWDYIVVDEASMIPLINMVYLLYSQKPQKFIVAGDPFQIEPTMSEESWKKENIYTMVGLDKKNSFTNPKTEPISYHVEKLVRQYRSVPSIGKVFSLLTYGGTLEHERDENSRMQFDDYDGLSIKPLNVVKFPMVKYESIYRSKKLKGSSYQIYAALFTYEFTRHLANVISKKKPGENISIGIVSPYKAQADLIGNLLRSFNAPNGISIFCGTVHSFQGDECNIMLTVFNAPENITDSDKMFLNRQNIINVAISRARDALIVLMPNDKTEKVENLKIVKELESLMDNSKEFFQELDSQFVERWMFGKENYLEENTFSTGHQAVNVYGVPERRYEVRSEDEAVDIQLHNQL